MQLHHHAHADISSVPMHRQDDNSFVSRHDAKHGAAMTQNTVHPRVLVMTVVGSGVPNSPTHLCVRGMPDTMRH